MHTQSDTSSRPAEAVIDASAGGNGADGVAASAEAVAESAGPAAVEGLAADPAKDEQISAIIAEFSDVFAFARSRWASYASEIHSELKGAGLMILQLILRKGPVTATGIAQMLDMDKAVVSRQIAKLRDLDLVDTEPAPEDRRVVLLTASAHAQQLMDRIRENWAHSYHERFANWSSADLATLREGLHRFNAATHEVHIDGPAGRCARGHGGGAAE